MTNLVLGNPVVGRNEDVLKIIMLLSRFCSGQEVLTIVSIVVIVPINRREEKKKKEKGRDFYDSFFARRRR